MVSSTTIENLPKEIIKIIAEYLDERFLPFSSTSRYFFQMFKEERNRFIQTGKMTFTSGALYLFTFEGDLYARGNNNNGQLGVGDTNYRNQWTKTGPENKKILEVSNFFGNTMDISCDNIFVRCSDGWYTCGSNHYGQFGTGDKNNLHHWTKMGLVGKEILKIIRTTKNTMVRCNDGWYVCGKLGDDHRDTNYQCDWIKLGPLNKEVLEIVAGNKNICVRCHDGWYACGNIGHPLFTGAVENTNWSLWVKISPPNQEVLAVIVGHEDIFIHCKDGLYELKKNNYYEKAIEDNHLFKWIQTGPEDKEILKIMSHKESIFIGCSDGWYVRDNETLDQHDPTYREQNVNRSQWIKFGPIDKEVLEIFVGGEMLRRGNIVVRCNDGLYASGDNDFGQLGQKYGTEYYDKTRYKGWIKIGPKNKEILGVINGERLTFARCNDGWYASKHYRFFQLCSDDSSEENWGKVGLSGKNALEIIGNPMAVFVRCIEGWFGIGINLGKLFDTENLEGWLKILGPEVKSNIP
jgi:hypothetical protein